MSNKNILDSFQKSIANLEEVLKLDKNAINRDASIKRFELCFDLAWKAVKHYAKNQAVECYSPRECFRAAYQLKLIEYSEEWMKMVDNRNLCAHLYSQEMADEVYARLKGYAAMLLLLLKKLS